jgi:hypothetical protein
MSVKLVTPSGIEHTMPQPTSPPRSSEAVAAAALIVVVSVRTAVSRDS